jgi:hypothetical protein
VRRYLWKQHYGAEDYIALLDTFSGHIAMDPRKRSRLYGAIRARIGGGQVRRHWYAILHVARRAEG